MFEKLDNPIWFALTTAHQSLARKRGSADLSSEAFADLSALVEPREIVALFTTVPLDVPGNWETLRTRWIDQMVCAKPIALQSTDAIRPLGPSDIPEMLALTHATEPGPFASNTIAMGRYFGIRSSDGRLAAMAGERLKLDDLTEVSAVCTHPDFRGKGHGKALVAHMAGLIQREGKTPFLHARFGLR
jgi:hypothetical protein